jgi:hypothetical protein
LGQSSLAKNLSANIALRKSRSALQLSDRESEKKV